MNEIAQLLAFITCSCFGPRKRSPVLLLAGICCSTFSLLLLASPHIFFGSGRAALDLANHYAHKVPAYVPTGTQEYIETTTFFTTLEERVTSTIDYQTNLESTTPETTKESIFNSNNTVLHLFTKSLEKRNADNNAFSLGEGKK